MNKQGFPSIGVGDLADGFSIGPSAIGGSNPLALATWPIASNPESIGPSAISSSSSCDLSSIVSHRRTDEVDDGKGL